MTIVASLLSNDTLAIYWVSVVPKDLVELILYSCFWYDLFYLLS